MNKITYAFNHWKLGIHLILKTRYFGVNNLLWSSFPSIWGHPIYRILLSIIFIYPLIRNYRAVKLRMGKSIGFIPADEFNVLFDEKGFFF